jgi:hypothetical protein
MQFSQDGSYVVTASLDKTAKLVDVCTLEVRSVCVWDTSVCVCVCVCVCGRGTAHAGVFTSCARWSKLAMPAGEAVSGCRCSALPPCHPPTAEDAPTHTRNPCPLPHAPPQVLKTYKTGRFVQSAAISPLMDHVLAGGGQDASQVRRPCGVFGLESGRAAGSVSWPPPEVRRQ